MWSDGRHWLKEKILYYPPEKGGLGLSCLDARTLTFRFTMLQRFLGNSLHPVFTFMSYFLKQYRNLKFDSQIFLINPEDHYLGLLPDFYRNTVRAWRLSRAQIVIPPDKAHYILNLPSNANYFDKFAESDRLLSPRLLLWGIHVVGDLIDSSNGKWSSAEEYTLPVDVRRSSTRLLQAELDKVKEKLIRFFPKMFDTTGYRLSLQLLHTVPRFSDLPLTVLIPPDYNATSASSKTIYHILNEELNSLKEPIKTYWHEHNIISPNRRIPWKELYRLPSSKKEGDVQFRLLHNFLPNLPVLHHINPNILPTCAWCGERGTTLHLFIQCPAIQPALNLLSSLLSRLCPDLVQDFDLYWSLLPHDGGCSQ